jgi:flagellar biogenesis protein FliO
VTVLMAASTFTLPEGGGGPAWWQTVGGMLVVFGLLVVCLRLLARFNRRGGAGQASLLAVWHLGPRREIQVLRLADEVHYVYRHDGAMVLLKQESWAEWQRSRPAAETAKTPETGAGPRMSLPLAALPAALRARMADSGR